MKRLLTKETLMKVASFAMALMSGVSVAEFIAARGAAGPSVPFYQAPQQVLLLVQFLVFGVAGYFGLFPTTRRDLMFIGMAPVAAMAISYFSEEPGIVFGWLWVVKTVLAVAFIIMLYVRYFHGAKK